MYVVVVVEVTLSSDGYHLVSCSQTPSASLPRESGYIRLVFWLLIGCVSLSITSVHMYTVLLLMLQSRIFQIQGI